MLVRLGLVALWVPVAVDKFWDLNGFHSTLLRQPFPTWWAGILFWLLPLLELLAAVLIAWPQQFADRIRHAEFDSASRTRVAEATLNPYTSSTAGQRWTTRSGMVVSPTLRIGLGLSTILLFGFTLFILFGVLGWYAQRPCGCGSVISGLSWEQHLWFNIAFLLISVLGLWLTLDKKSQNPSSPLSSRRQEGSPHTHAPFLNTVNGLFKEFFPRKFALFRRRAVIHQTLPAGLHRGSNQRHVTGHHVSGRTT